MTNDKSVRFIPILSTYSIIFYPLNMQLTVNLNFFNESKTKGTIEISKSCTELKSIGRYFQNEISIKIGGHKNVK